MLQIYNSLARSKQALVPIEPGKVRMYVCGITVYDFCHIGHARMLVVFDVVYRYLKASGFDVTYVRNITDIDDKIIKRALENNESIDALTQRFIQHMNEDSDALNVLRPTVEPRATAHIEQIINMIQLLVERGYAYQASNGDVYYDVSSFAAYGKLSGKKPAELQAGARVEIDEVKDDPLDFVLWKRAKPNEPQWSSPFGPGRPGWHIECSAMSTHCLGNHFDIHGGGQDLQFPHHENEIAQSEGATGEGFARLWMHNGFVRVDDEKMSKSLGNFFTIREVIAKGYDADIIRYFILTSHYRSELNYSEENLNHARDALTRFYLALRGLTPKPHHANAYEERFRQAMDDDFNTPEALAVLFDLVREINRVRDSDRAQADDLAGTLLYLGSMLGLLQADPESYLRRPAAGTDAGSETRHVLLDRDIEQLILERNDARGRKDWAAADRVRKELSDAGIILEDGPQGTTWRRGS